MSNAVSSALAPHPHDAVTPIVDEHRGAGEFHDELRRDRDADDVQSLPSSIHDGVETVARVQRIELCEALADEHFLMMAARDPPAAADLQVVEHRTSDLVDGHDVSDRRLGESWDIEPHVAHDARLRDPTPGIAAMRGATPAGARCSCANTSPKRYSS